MILKVIKQYNQLSQTALTNVLILEPSDRSDIKCAICHKELKPDGWAYFSKERGIFNCPDCLEDGVTHGFKTGFKIPIMCYRYKTFALPILIRRFEIK